MLTILHDDCTFASYSTFKEDGIYVEEGDYLYPGEPIGLLAGNESRFGKQIRLLIYYRNDEFLTINRENPDGVQRNKYVKPAFRTSEGKSISIERNRKYISIHPEEVIISEMSRRERRNWARNN